MDEHSIVFVRLYVWRERDAEAVAEGGGAPNVRYLGKIGSSDARLYRETL